VISKATAADPDWRYLSVDAFLAAFGLASGAASELDETMYTATENPYKGLQAFGENDADDFFGRESVIAELVAAVAEHRFVAVVGPSGIGISTESSRPAMRMRPFTVRGFAGSRELH
jgi:hypothetical protein